MPVSILDQPYCSQHCRTYMNPFADLECGYATKGYKRCMRMPPYFVAIECNKRQYFGTLTLKEFIKIVS